MNVLSVTNDNHDSTHGHYGKIKPDIKEQSDSSDDCMYTDEQKVGVTTPTFCTRAPLFHNIIYYGSCRSGALLKYLFRSYSWRSFFYAMFNSSVII